MGFKKEWDMNAITHQIWAIRYEATSFRNDGWVSFDAKKDLYKLKWQIDEALQACGSFAGETEWLNEQEQNKIIEILKR
jgi:hypothetical protein